MGDEEASVSIIDLTKEEPDQSSNNNDNNNQQPECVIIQDDSIIIGERRSKRRPRPNCDDIPCPYIEIPDSPPSKISPSGRRSRLSSTSKPHTIAPRPPPSPRAEGMKCPICIETCINIKKRGVKIIVTKCGHIFCDNCIKQSFQATGRKCPKCRKNVPKGPLIEVFDVC